MPSYESRRQWKRETKSSLPDECQQQSYSWASEGNVRMWNGLSVQLWNPWKAIRTEPP